MASEKDPRETAPKRLGAVQLALVALFALLFAGSLALRMRAEPERGPAGLPAGASGLVQGGAEATPAPEATPLERSLPYVTESSLFGLIGFALGYATRKFVKLALIVLALFFLGLQGLSWMGAVTIDWSVIVAKLNGWIFDLQEGESMTTFLTRRIPSAGGLLLGVWAGFARG